MGLTATSNGWAAGQLAAQQDVGAQIADLQPEAFLDGRGSGHPRPGGGGDAPIDESQGRRAGQAPRRPPSPVRRRGSARPCRREWAGIGPDRGACGRRVRSPSSWSGLRLPRRWPRRSSRRRWRFRTRRRPCRRSQWRWPRRWVRRCAVRFRRLREGCPGRAARLRRRPANRLAATRVRLLPGWPAGRRWRRDRPGPGCWSSHAPVFWAPKAV